MSVNQMNREPGFYWVKFNKDSEWVIAEYQFEDWYFCGVEQSLFDDFHEIDERRITREEPAE